MIDADLSPMSIVRILCGIWFIPHIIAKLRDVGFAAQNFEKAGFKPARFFVFLAVCIETIAALGLIFCILPKVAALFASVILLGAAYATVRIGGINWAWHRFGMEYLLFWMLICNLSVWGA